MRLRQLYPALGDRQLNKEFATAYKQCTGHDLKDHYEPDAIRDPVATIDPDFLGANELVEDRFARLVRNAYDHEIISISRAGEMLNRSIDEMRVLVRAWQAL